MKSKFKLAFVGLLIAILALEAQEKTVVITTNVGTMEVKLYPDVPNHTRTFIERATKGEYNGALFTRVIKDFMIQGGSPDSKNAPAGARVGFGDRNAEILPEFRDQYFHKKGVLAAPRQGDEINPQKKSDMSQFYIVQGKVYRPGELDTMQIIKNAPIRKKAMNDNYLPIREELDSLRASNPVEYNKRAVEINAKVDSVINATPGHLIFTPEQREAYITVGGTPHLDSQYTIYGELSSGFDVLDQIASQPRDTYDRPKKDIRIISITIK
jgi:cyclophilin family peptidyl-prolyl cis-trans isomerase